MERIRATEFGATIRVLSIGVGRFDDPAIEPLGAVEREARELASTLADPDGCAIPADQVKVLTGVASAEILAALKTASDQCLGDSVLIVYFSGHAFRAETGIYLCGANAQRVSLRSTSVSSMEIDEALSSCTARGVLVILDCCVSAGFAENAPTFFRHTQGGDFRVLLAASREDQPSWEVGNGEGTLFSKYLIGIVRGAIPVGIRPGEISLTDLVEGIDFHVNEDLRALHPEVPAQEPIVAGSFSRDPVLFFHRGLALAGLTVERDRVSRSLHRRVIRRLVIGGIIAAVFGAFTYLSWLDKHLYATADANIVRIYRGYPGWGGPGFPTLIWEQPMSATAFRSDSPLKTGGTIIAPLDRPIEPLLDQQFNEVAMLSELRRTGKTSEARERLLQMLDRTDLSPESSIFARLLLADVATADDLPRLRNLLNDSRPEIRTSSIRGLLRIAPKEAFASLTSALSDSERFDQRALIYEIPFSCPEGGDAYYETASKSAVFNGVYAQLTDTAVRAGCHISRSGFAALLRFWPEYQLGDLARYAQLFHEANWSGAADDGSDLLRRGFLDSAATCPVEIAIRRFRESSGSAAQNDTEVLLLSPACTQDERVHVARDAQGDLEIAIKGTPVSLKVPPSVKPDVGTALVPLLEARADSAAFTFLEAIVRGNPDNTMKAEALEVLNRNRWRFQPASELLNSGNLQLRRAAYAAFAVVDHGAAFESIRARINDQDLLDWPELVFSVHPTEADLDRIRPHLRGGARERERAASVFAIFGSGDDIRRLATDASYDVRHAVEQYIGANQVLLQLKVTGAKEPYDDFDSIVSTAQKKGRDLKRELDAIPASLRAWRIRQILTWRGNSFDTSFRQVLQPGLKLWLAAAQM